MKAGRLKKFLQDLKAIWRTSTKHKDLEKLWQDFLGLKKKYELFILAPPEVLEEILEDISKDGVSIIYFSLIYNIYLSKAHHLDRHWYPSDIIFYAASYEKKTAWNLSWIDGNGAEMVRFIIWRGWAEGDVRGTDILKLFIYRQGWDWIQLPNQIDLEKQEHQHDPSSKTCQQNRHGNQWTVHGSPKWKNWKEKHLYASKIMEKAKC